jgi:indolepyruvate ferredoxin oxidoreductase beta subunit
MSAPVRILISALGGEGGGVLASWIADAALACGFIAQRTSVPGVAQRTGSTTYYIEMAPAGARRPVLALAPAPGEVDLFIATEELEAGRLIQAGFVTQQRTTIILPRRRVYSIMEKIALTDGRVDSDLILQAAERFSKARLIADFEALATQAGAHLNAVLFGVAARILGLSAQACRQTIEQDGRATAANLRGFDAGFAFEGEDKASMIVEAPPEIAPPPNADAPFAGDFIVQCPAQAQAFLRAGVERLIDFQDERYAKAYLARLAPFRDAAGMKAESFSELARLLALRMTSEDVARVAQLKIRAARLARVKAESRARPGDLVNVTEYLKPGPAEIFSMLPAPVARALLRLTAWAGLSAFAAPLRVRTNGLAGFLQMKALAAMRRLRPLSLRAQEERAWVDEWLDAIMRAMPIDPATAHEIILTAQLVRGYGETWERGQRNWRRIFDEIVTPALTGAIAPAHAADAVLQARLAASADDTGAQLHQLIVSLKRLTNGRDAPHNARA